MSCRTSLVALSLSVGLAALALPVAAHPGGHDHEAAPAKPAPAPAPAMSAEEQKAMEAWMKTRSPGEHHANLEPTVGLFEAKVNHWMAPDQPPMTSTGFSRNQWVLGGRFVESKFEGSFMGEPFVGIGYTGYDNVINKYVGSWMDNMGTGFMNSLGDKTSPDTFTFSATASDPMTGKTVTFRQVMTIKDRDHHAFEMFAPGPDGKEMRMMEISYTRRN